jgi:uncharacterized protein YecE (DUF72 family)
VSAHGRVRIGISGWRYKPWRGVFYPPKLAQRTELTFAASAFSTIEINGSFYSLQRPSHYEQWSAATPEDFVFAIKGSRYITHMRRLREVRIPLANFFASGILKLEAKLGPFLWQFPPNFRFNPDLLDEFFTLLPRDTEAAAALASEHEPWMKGRVSLETSRCRPLRHAIEIRHDSFVCPEFIRLLRRHRIALVCADTVEWPRLLDVTTDFLYLRLHGSKVLYASGYSDVDLDLWAERVAAWASGSEPSNSKLSGEHGSSKPSGSEHGQLKSGSKAPEALYASPTHARRRAKRDVYVYFDNDVKVRAPFDAQGLIARVDKRLSADSSPSPGRLS